MQHGNEYWSPGSRSISAINHESSESGQHENSKDIEEQSEPSSESIEIQYLKLHRA